MLAQTKTAIAQNSKHKYIRSAIRSFMRISGHYPSPEVTVANRHLHSQPLCECEGDFSPVTGTTIYYEAMKTTLLCLYVRPGSEELIVTSTIPYRPQARNTSVCKSRALKLELTEGEDQTFTIEPATKGSTYVCGWRVHQTRSS